MFGLFKKKDAGVPVTDHIWMHEQAKWQACYEAYQQDGRTLFLSWFEESRNKLQQYLTAKGVSDALIVDANFSGTAQGTDNIIFIEHFPLQTEEQSKFADLRLTQAKVYSSLDEPIFQMFGGGKIVGLMQKMGMKENEMIQHAMITASVKRAQEKIGEKAIVMGSARSQHDWLLNAGINSDEN